MVRFNAMASRSSLFAAVAATGLFGILTLATPAHARSLPAFNGAGLTEEERLAEQQRKKADLPDYRLKGQQKPFEIPWGSIGMLVVMLGVAAPFAYRIFRETSDEISGKNSGLNQASNDPPNV